MRAVTCSQLCLYVCVSAEHIQGFSATCVGVDINYASASTALRQQRDAHRERCGHLSEAAETEKGRDSTAPLHFTRVLTILKQYRGLHKQQISKHLLPPRTSLTAATHPHHNPTAQPQHHTERKKRAAGKS